ncbi:hypothetical protein F0562_025725 [Nyssa sinensis]|uniref:Uncharacterized protein n=1 Tax=Nyssa sinensis TaxID=561372 RepID=A0A5J5B740_9ASTE|nr:hypothetical protein F0562_025725 [Nyssa sinensis]
MRTQLLARKENKGNLRERDLCQGVAYLLPPSELATAPLFGRKPAASGAAAKKKKPDAAVVNGLKLREVATGSGGNGVRSWGKQFAARENGRFREAVVVAVATAATGSKGSTGGAVRLNQGCGNFWCKMS